MLRRLFKSQNNDTPRKLLGVGHSHILSIRYAVNSILEDLEAKKVKLDTIWLGEEPFTNYQSRLPNGDINGYQFSNPLSDSLRDLNPKRDILFSAFGGNAHNILGLVRHPIIFDFILENSSSASLDEAAQIIPSKLVEFAMVSQGGFPETRWGLRAIREAFSGQIIHCESPPPIFSNDFLSKNAGVFKNQFLKFGISPPMLRYKLWVLHSNLVRKECDILGIEFLQSPKSFVSDEGFLADQGLSNDTTHANPAYGKAVISQLLDLLAQKKLRE